MIQQPHATASQKRTLEFLQAKKAARQKITMLTCYDYPTARAEDEAGIDIIFVGDSVGTNVLGYDSEREVTVADMVHHLKAVRRGVVQGYLLVDMPYQSYATPERALAHARTFLDHGADAVKIEGGHEQKEIVQSLTAHGIPVCGHIGYTPQTMRQVGKRARVQGRSLEEARALVQSALALEQAGLALLVLELVPTQLSRLITERLQIPTIGIGAGPFCDGQVLVVNDVLGISPVQLRLAKHYDRYHERTRRAIEQYRHEVEQMLFPLEENSFAMDEREFAELEVWAMNLS